MTDSYTNQTYTLNFKGELQRKLLHIFSSAIPIGYLFIERSVVLSILIPLLVLMFLVEALKYRSEFIYKLYIKFFKHMLKEHEFDRKKIRINGASWVLMTDVMCIILFPKLVAITGMLMLSLADSLSGLIGRMYGKKQFAPNRTYIGSLTFLIIGILIILLSPKYLYTPSEYVLGFIAVFITTATDSINIPADDNFIIPFVSSLSLYALYIIFFPGIFGVS